MPVDLAGEHPHGPGGGPPPLKARGAVQVLPRRLDLVADPLELVGEVAQPVAGLALVRRPSLFDVDTEVRGERGGVDLGGVRVRGGGAQGGEQRDGGPEAAARAIPFGDALCLPAAERRHDRRQGPDTASTRHERLVPTHDAAERVGSGGSAAAPAPEEPGRRDHVQTEILRRVHARERRRRGMLLEGGRAHRQHRRVDARPQPEVPQARRRQVEDEIVVPPHGLGRDLSRLPCVARLALADGEALLRDRPARQRGLLGEPDAQERDGAAENAIGVGEEERGVGGMGPASGTEEGRDQGQSP
ncbi:hypothetical protein [Methylobacterium komagatae]